MSSARKEARWQLAWEMIAGAHLAWDKLTYQAKQAILDAAETIIEQTDPVIIQRYADRWNGKA